MIETYCKNAQPHNQVKGGHKVLEADTAKIPLVDEMPMVP